MMTTPAPRSTADARRTVVLSKAISVFARTGYHATPVADVAEAAKISPAYVFRLFGTKKELYLAATRLKMEETYQAFLAHVAKARGRTPEEIQATDLESIFSQIGLDQHLSPNRRNGFFSMVEKIKASARARIAARD